MRIRNGLSRPSGREMSVMYEIRTLGDPVLRERCHEVTQFDRKLRRLAEAMLTVMDEAEGIGSSCGGIRRRGSRRPS